MRRREQWGARFNYTNSRPVEEPATRVFVHITVTNPRAYSSNDAHARAIESIGINRFPATGISYNRLVMPDGSLYEAQPIGRRGAHTVNDFKRSTCSTSGCPGRGTSLTAPSWNLNINARAYVICQNVGDPVSAKMVDTLARAIVADYRAGFITRAAAHNLHGHRCASSKLCPGDKMWSRMGDLHTLIHRYLDNGLPGSTPPPSEDDMPYRDWPKADKDALLSDIFDAVWKTDTDTKGIPAPDGYNADGSNPFWAASSMLRSIQFYARKAATPQDLEALAAAIAAKLPPGAVDLATVKQGVAEALREGIGSDPA